MHMFSINHLMIGAPNFDPCPNVISSWNSDIPQDIISSITAARWLTKDLPAFQFILVKAWGWLWDDTVKGEWAVTKTGDKSLEPT